MEQHKLWHKSLWNRLQLQFGELQQPTYCS